MFYEYWGFDEWCTITTIILSVVAIIIAICSSHSTSKDANRQIREIKNLSALQIDKESQEIADIYKGGEQLGPDYRNAMMRKHQENKPLRDLQIYSDCSHNLNEILNELKNLKNKLG